jgi:hypothetical protein
MKCEQLSELTGIRCEPLPMRDGSQAVALQTPFSFFDGDGFEVYAAAAGSQVHFFDDGLTLHWLRGTGFKIGDDRRRWAPIRSAAQPYGVALAEDGTLETFAPLANAAAGFARMISALLAVDTWARDHAGMPHDAQWLVEEAMMYLRAWKPKAVFVERPQPVMGMSGKPYAFQMSLDGELVDAIAPHPNATGGELRKLVDVRASVRNRDLDIRVILDDRRDPDAAAQEGAILGNLCNAWTMSKLILAAGAPALTQ